jgi:hypothetical protein
MQQVSNVCRLNDRFFKKINVDVFIAEMPSCALGEAANFLARESVGNFSNYSMCKLFHLALPTEGLQRPIGGPEVSKLRNVITCKVTDRFERHLNRSLSEPISRRPSKNKLQFPSGAISEIDILANFDEKKG